MLGSGDGGPDGRELSLSVGPPDGVVDSDKEGSTRPGARFRLQFSDAIALRGVLGSLLLEVVMGWRAGRVLGRLYLDLLAWSKIWTTRRPNRLLATVGPPEGVRRQHASSTDA